MKDWRELEQTQTVTVILPVRQILAMIQIRREQRASGKSLEGLDNSSLLREALDLYFEREGLETRRIGRGGNCERSAGANEGGSQPDP